MPYEVQMSQSESYEPNRIIRVILTHYDSCDSEEIVEKLHL